MTYHDIPAQDIAAACRALEDGHTHYTHSLGNPRLREAICAYYARTYQVAVQPDQVVVTSGTSPAMLLAFAALLEEGDQVILSDPRYACYANLVKLVQGIPVSVPVCEEDGFQYRPEAIQAKITPQTRAIVIASGNNTSISNDGDIVRLRDASGIEVDAVGSGMRGGAPLSRASTGSGSGRT